ncbi:M23 family metallopeptidase [Streptomyces rimosus]|uniref:peptidoglycan DD-metalloendopeptidase family protein n=1 Tax=Streptomyces rimosus TaxID=1927 RepID=UPI000D16289A|nr:M23 family metallopeptidase [Streptomyces rimosus]
MTLSLVVALSATAGAAPVATGAAFAGAPTAMTAAAEPGAVEHLPPSSAPVRTPEVRDQVADRLAAASLEVIRLGRDAGRTGRSYAAVLRAARAGHARISRLHAELRREQRTADELRRRAGRIAVAQYRTGRRLPVLRSARASGAPQAVLSAYRKAERRQRLLAAHARDALRASRSLAVDSVATYVRTAELDTRRTRLDAERRRIGRRLGAARGLLHKVSRQSARSGRCGRLPGTVSAVAKRSATEVSPVPASGGRWTRPVERYQLSAGFGGAGSRWAHRHTGQDFAVPVGTPVRSVGRGRVLSLTCGDSFGISMVVQHGAGTFTQYAHLSAVVVGAGQQVRAGQQIALSGSTGNSTGPHVHFEVRRTPQVGSGVDPVPWLRGRGVRV